MEHKKSLKIIWITLGILFLFLLVIVVTVPSLNELFAVEVNQQQEPPVMQIPLPERPKDVTATVHYQMEQNSKKISAIYIEVYHVGSSKVVYLEIPADTKVNLSEELYKSLQTYAPELPQYFKLSNMAESFSENYDLTGGNRILSELLGVSVTEYVRTDKEAMDAWLSAQQDSATKKKFFDAYTKWLGNSTAGCSLEERWMYYESRKEVREVQVELAPGSREKDGYVLSGKRSGERFKELMLQKETE